MNREIELLLIDLRNGGVTHDDWETAREAVDQIELLITLLAHAVKEADGWHDECRCGPIQDDPLIDEARLIIGGKNEA